MLQDVINIYPRDVTIEDNIMAAIKYYRDEAFAIQENFVSSPLNFRRITLNDLPEINRIVQMSRSMTCDYTLGGIFMWVDYFRYRFCIYRDTLFISGVEENNLDKIAFSCPIGCLPLPEAIGLLQDYCEERGLPLQFSAIPADNLICFTTINPEAEVEELDDWSDYVYEIENFATLSGKKMSKKRNHVNRFKADYPHAVLEKLSKEDVPQLIGAMKEWKAEEEGEVASATASEEMREVIDVLENLELFGFEGAVLRLEPQGAIAGFTLAEVINDTAFIHIEKMNHGIAGAGETLAHLFATRLMEKFPTLRYANREEACGDEGLKRAKESWHPAMLLKKYNVLI